MTQQGAVTVPSAGGRPPARHGAVLFGLGIFAVAVATRLSHLSAIPFYDEFYHLLAATSWRDNGTFAVYQGEYGRAGLYTIFTAWMFDLAGGPSIEIARAPNVIFGALLAAASAVWTRQVAGSLAGWIVAVCVLLWPSGIYVSQVVRFYAIHGLLFFVGAVATYDFFRPGITSHRRLVMAGAAISSLWLAEQLQISTLVGVLGLAAWAALFVILPEVMRHRRRRMILIAGAGLVSLMFLATVATGVLQDIWDLYSYSPWGWDPTAYHRVLRDSYPLLWPATPILAIFAFRASPRPAGFCGTLVACGLVIHSLSGVTNVRYIYYLSPFLFALWAIGLQAVLPAVVGHLRRAADPLFGGLEGSRVVSAAIVGAGLFAVFANAAATRSIELIVGNVAQPFQANSDWSDARQPISEYAEKGALVVVTDDLAAIYYLGGFDVAFSKNWHPEMNETEFARDPRTGRPHISRIDSVEDLVQAYPEGVFVAQEGWWSEWPRNNSLTAFLGAFNSPNVDWSIEEAGSVSILHWRSEVLPDSQRARRVRELVGERKSARLSGPVHVRCNSERAASPAAELAIAPSCSEEALA